MQFYKGEYMKKRSKVKKKQTIEKEVKYESIEGFLARGGEIEKIEAVVPEDKGPTVRKLQHGPPELKTLSEAALLYGEKKKHTRKKKPIDLSKIDKDSIPDSLKYMLETTQYDEKNDE